MGVTVEELPRAGVGARLFAGVLVLAMAVGSIALWTVVPLSWLWLAAALGGTYFFSYLVALAGAPLTMIALAAGLYRIQNVYARLSGTTTVTPQRHAWLKSVRDDRTRRRTTLLDVFLIASALVAVIALVVWYLGFADTVNPTGPLAPGGEHGI